MQNFFFHLVSSQVIIEHKQHQHLCRVFAFERIKATSQHSFQPLIEDDIIFLKPEFAFNLKAEYMNSSVSIRPFNGMKKNQPPTATEVHIARVRSPLTDGYTSYVEPLKQFFSVPKLVQLGDLISIPMFKGF